LRPKSTRTWESSPALDGKDLHKWDFNGILMGFYGILMGFIVDLMGFIVDLMGFIMGNNGILMGYTLWQ
jgi:hypothetical protein